MNELIRLYRAVTRIELEDLHAHNGRFRDSPHKSGEKGFFYDLASAAMFARQAEEAYSEPHFVFSTEASPSALKGSRVHHAATEGRGVYLRASALHLLTPAVQESF